MSSSTSSAVPAVHSMIYLGMDVHKESITIAVLPAGNEVADSTRQTAQRFDEVEEMAGANCETERFARVTKRVAPAM